MMRFAASGVRTPLWLPPSVSFAIAAICSTAGVSGAFLLLPFQISLLGFVGPAVTPTNHLFNAIAIPSGVYRYIRERRMVWPLALLLLVGTVPGVVAGSLARMHLLADPRAFKLFVGLVLLLIASRMLLQVARPRAKSAAPSGPLQVDIRRFDIGRLEFDYAGAGYGISSWGLALITTAIGAIGGAYGVGGGSIISPLLVSVFKQPVHAIAGATLSSTFVSSLVGIGSFALAGPLFGRPAVMPDWQLGGLLGVGGLAGMYCGARVQRYLPARAIEATLAALVTVVAARYVIGFFW